jgi:hypothetical protein
VQPSSDVSKLLINMANISGKPAWMHLPGTRMGAIASGFVNKWKFNLYIQLYAVLDMITIVARIKILRNVKSCDTIDK